MNHCTEVCFATFLSGGSNESTGKETEKTHFCALQTIKKEKGSKKPLYWKESHKEKHERTESKTES